MYKYKYIYIIRVPRENTMAWSQITIIRHSERIRSLTSIHHCSLFRIFIVYLEMNLEHIIVSIMYNEN